MDSCSHLGLIKSSTRGLNRPHPYSKTLEKIFLFEVILRRISNLFASSDLLYFMFQILMNVKLDRLYVLMTAETVQVLSPASVTLDMR